MLFRSGQGVLACCDSWGHKELNTNEHKMGDSIENLGVLVIPEFPFSNDFLPFTGRLPLSHVYGRMDVYMSHV